MRRLIDLRPAWCGVLRPTNAEGITFDCPTCGPSHRLAAYFTNPIDEGPANSWNAHWTRHGHTFDGLSLSPSIDYPCFHGWVEYGLVFDVSESPLVVPGILVGMPQAPTVAMSPDQAEKFARQILEAVDKVRSGT